MICSSCCWAGHHNTIGKTDLAKEFHEKCEGDCGCQHRTGPKLSLHSRCRQTFRRRSKGRAQRLSAVLYAR